jgi:hypothetical protein
MTEKKEKKEKKYPILTASNAQKIINKYKRLLDETDDINTLLVDMENLDILINEIKNKNDITMIKFLNKKIGDILKQDISGLNNLLKWQVIEAILYFTFNNFESEKELKDNYNNYKKTGNTDFITREFKNAIEEYGNIDEIDTLMSDIDRRGHFLFTPLQESYIDSKLQEQEEKAQKNKKIFRKILKDYPYLRWYITTIDLNYEFQMEQLKERMMIYDSPLSTSIKKILKYMGFVVEDSDTTIEESKRLIELFHEHKIHNLGDLIKASKFTWKSISKNVLFNNNIDFDFFMKIIASYLYPKYKLYIDVNEGLAKEIFYIKCAQEISDQDDDIQNECTNKWGELIEGAQNNEELRQLYKDIYYGFDIPEAPPAPMFSIPSYSSKRKIRRNSRF